MMVATVELPSPNFDDRPAGKPINTLVLHYTGMPTAAEALERLCDPAARVSAHYTVDEDGTIYRHLPEAKRAWHAGLSYWRGERDVNGISIGIEIVNPGHEFGYRSFPQAQMNSVIALSVDIVARHGIAPARVLAHSDVAPDRKQDPGELFDWRALAAAGVGLWPEPAEPVAADVAEIQGWLSSFGYDLEITGVLDANTRSVIRAFQRHFRQERVDGEADAETAALARAVAGLRGDEDACRSD